MVYILSPALFLIYSQIPDKTVNFAFKFLAAHVIYDCICVRFRIALITLTPVRQLYCSKARFITNTQIHQSASLNQFV